jgi:hypothetical protein
MQSLALLSFMLTAAQPVESPADVAAWLDGRFEAGIGMETVALRPVVGDEVFLRRSYLELTGTVPAVAEARDFLDDTSANKRAQLVHTLLKDKRYSQHFARLWSRTLAPTGTTRGPLEAWLQTEFRKNTPFDKMAKAILTAKGDVAVASPAAFYLAVGNAPDRLAEAVARGFMGIRLGCAQCHNHPLAEWKQEDFWGLAAFFAGTGSMPRRIDDSNERTITVPETSKVYAAKFLNGAAPDFKTGRPPRALLAEWLATPANHFFAANVVNRVWRDMCGSGLVSAVDDLDSVDADERNWILDELAAKFAKSGFNMQWLVETICLSKTYQRASAGSEPSPGLRPVRALSPDQVLASIDQALSLKKGRGLSLQYTPEGRTLMARLEESRGATPTDFKGGIPQALLLMNGAIITEATTLESSMTLRAVVEAPFLDEPEKLKTLFLAAYSRPPRPEENERFLKFVRAKPDEETRRQAYANIFWAMLNSPEFVLCP